MQRLTVTTNFRSKFSWRKTSGIQKATALHGTLNTQPINHEETNKPSYNANVTQHPNILSLTETIAVSWLSNKQSPFNQPWHTCNLHLKQVTIPFKWICIHSSRIYRKNKRKTNIIQGQQTRGRRLRGWIRHPKDFFAMRAVSCRVHHSHSLWLEFLEQVGLAVIRGEGNRKGMWELLQTQLQTVAINLWVDATAAVWELQSVRMCPSEEELGWLSQMWVEVWEITFLCQINSSAHLVIERFVIYGLKWYLKERFGLESTSR